MISLSDVLKGVKMSFKMIRTAAAVALALMSGVALANDVTGAGASFPAPLYSKWAAAYNQATKVQVNYQSVGSGAGIKQIKAKTVTAVSPLSTSCRPACWTSWLKVLSSVFWPMTPRALLGPEVEVAQPPNCTSAAKARVLRIRRRGGQKVMCLSDGWILACL